VIDLHSHILPGLDDGAPDLETSLKMARAAVAGGVRTMVATPHVNSTYSVDAATLSQAVGALNLELSRAEMQLAVLSGAEIALPEAAALGDDELRGLALGGGDCLLVESPYIRGVFVIESVLESLRARGFRPMLAHPERSPTLQDDPRLMARLAEAGTLFAVNAGSLTGRFGPKVRDTADRLVVNGQAHVVTSDAHDLEHRPPGLAAPLFLAGTRLPAVRVQAEWLTQAAPAAILAGEPLPPRPVLPPPPTEPRGWQGALARSALGRSAVARRLLGRG
jgi:protein-tyrosine phosphatase